MRRTVNLLLAAILATAVGAGAVSGLTHWRQHLMDDNPAFSASAPLDRVSHAIDGMRRDGVHVPRDGRSMLSAKDERHLEKQITAAGVPVRIVVWAPSRFAGANDAQDQVEAAFTDDEPGVVIIWEGPQKGSVFTTGRNGYVSDLYTQDLVGEPSVALAEAITKSQGVTWYPDQDESDYWGGRCPVRGMRTGDAVGLRMGAATALRRVPATAGWLAMRPPIDTQKGRHR